MEGWRWRNPPRALVCALVAVVLAGMARARAEEGDEDSPIRFSISAEFIVTADYEREEPAADAEEDARADSHSRIRPNMEDSDFFLAFDRRILGRDLLGGAAIRVRMEDNTAQPRLFAYFADRDFRLAFGRLRLNNKLIGFPTPRNEDLIVYTHILSGALGEKENSQNLYGDNVILDWYPRPSYLTLTAFYHGRAHSEFDAARGEYVIDDEDVTPGGGVGIVYSVPASDEPAWLRRAGLLYDTQYLERQNGESAQLDQMLAGAHFRFGQDGASAWEFKAQAIRSLGLEDRDASGERVFPQHEDDLAREASTVAIASLQWFHGGMHDPAWKAALIAATKSYGDISSGSRRTLVPNLLIPLADDFDLMFQVIYTEYGRGLAAITGRDRDYAVQAGIVFEFDEAFNDPRDYDSMAGAEPGHLLSGY